MFNKRKIQNLRHKISVLTRELNEFKREARIFRCEARTGHSMKFEKIDIISDLYVPGCHVPEYYTQAEIYVDVKIYIFRCSNCACKKRYRWKDLSTIQRNALTKLGIGE